MVCGMVFIQLASGSQPLIWAAFWLLTAVHVWANVRAMRCLSIHGLNQARLGLLLRHYLATVSAVLCCAVLCCAVLCLRVCCGVHEQLQGRTLSAASRSAAAAAVATTAITHSKTATCLPNNLLLQGEALQPAQLAAQESLVAPPVQRLLRRLGLGWLPAAGGLAGVQVTVATKLSSLVRSSSAF